LIDESGNQLGILPLQEALAIARERDLDLVEVAPRADPPVCRLLDYGKYTYAQAKREREARKAQKTVEIKEIRLRPKTNPYHASFKLKRAREFLEKGAKVRVRVMFRGRERDYPEIGRQLLANVVAQLEDIATVEQEPRMEGRTMHILLSPLKTK